MKAKHLASSSDEIAVFQAYTNLINSERETLWARHNALLLANSLSIGALAMSPASGSRSKDGRRYDGMLILPEPTLPPA